MNSEKYIITVSVSGTRLYIHRHYIDRYTCVDGLSRFHHAYGGRLTASDALTFDSKPKALAYVDRNNIKNAIVTKYDICRNCIMEEL